MQVQETHEFRCVRRSGGRFPERDCSMEIEIFRFAKMNLRAMCGALQTWLHFLGQEQYFRGMDWKNRKIHWHQAVSSLNFSVLEGRLPEALRFLTVSSSENGGTLAE